jgi:hypothetical protein
VILVTPEGASYDSINHVHDVGFVATALKGALRYCIDFLPNKIKHTEVKSVGVRSHSYKEIPVVGWNVGTICFPRSLRPPKKMVQVSIEGKKILSGSHTSSFIAMIHESQFSRIKTECKMNLVEIIIFFSKSKSLANCS